VQDSCNYCHGNKYENTLKVWKDVIDSGLAKAENVYANVKAEADTAQLSSIDRLDVNRLLDDASHNIRLVKLGHGVHNVNYSTALLSVANERCEAAAKIISTRQVTARASP